MLVVVVASGVYLFVPTCHSCRELVLIILQKTCLVSIKLLQEGGGVFVIGDTALVKMFHLNQNAYKRQVDYLLKHFSSFTPSPAIVVLVLNNLNEYPIIFSNKKGRVISR